MRPMNDEAFRPYIPEPFRKVPAVRTYRQIAEILAKREGRPISPERVKQECQTAERKFIRALLADPVFQDWPSPRTPPDQDN